jgi:hypothetical protein
MEGRKGLEERGRREFIATKRHEKSPCLRLGRQKGRGKQRRERCLQNLSGRYVQQALLRVNICASLLKPET